MIKNYLFFKLLILFIILYFIISKKKKISENFEQQKVYFYTFCVNIGRHSQNNLTESLKILLNSLNKKVKNFKLIVFKNFNINIKDPNVIYRNYYQGKIKLYNNDKWKELSFNKINIYKDLHNEFKKDFTWLDLDTIVMYDISYFNNYDNIFIVNGGISNKPQTLFKNNKKYSIVRKDYIQGNVWKINLSIYDKLIKCLNIDIKKRKLILKYDLQDLFNYYIYYKDKYSNYNLLGKNFKKNILNGLAVWENLKKTESNNEDIQGIKNLYIKNDVLKTRYYPKYDIHIISITFFKLNKLKDQKDFKNILLL